MLKRFISLLCVLAFVNMYYPAYASVNVPSNISIYISPVDTITSKDLEVDTIPCQVVNDVVVDNVVVIKAGAKAELHIGEMEKARCWGKGGKMLISNGYVYDVNGQKQKIILSKNVYGTDKTWPKTLGVISIFFLWPLALFGFVHGDQAKVSAAQELEVSLASQYIFEQ